MHRVTEKVENAAAVAKEKADIFKAKAQEKAEKATAMSKDDKMIAEERRKAKEYEAKMNLHQTKAEIIQEHKLRHHHHHDPVVGTAANQITGVPTSNYPLGLGGHPPHGHAKLP